MQDMTTTQKTLKPKHLPVNTELAPEYIIVAAFSGMN